MFQFLADIFMAPINFLRAAFFGWSPPEDVVELASTLVDNGGPSANVFAAMRKASYLDGMAQGVGDDISDQDWASLSMRDIDAKLLAAGALELGDAAGDPFYDLTPFDVMQQSQIEFESMLKSEAWQALMPAAWDGVIAAADWSTLSLAEIDAKLVAASLSALASVASDPFYSLSPGQIDALTDAQVFSRIDAFGWAPPYLSEWEGIIEPDQLDRLSAREIDGLLEAAALEPIGTQETPFYSLSAADVQLLPETAYQSLLDEEQAYFEGLGYAYNRPPSESDAAYQSADSASAVTTENDFLA